jgi:hypothetical protein
LLESWNFTEQSGDEVAAENRLRSDGANKELIARVAADARASPRYVINQAIRFMRKGHAPAPASLVNLSEGGALARIKAPVRAPEAAVIPPWPLRLGPGDELWLVDLIELPLSCWLIEAAVGLIRVHIHNDRRTRTPLQALLARLAGTSQQQRAEASCTPAERQRAEDTNPFPEGFWLI